MTRRGPTVTLYRRPACGLCDEAARALASLAPRLGFHIEAVDISADEALFERFGMAIPVIAMDGVEVARAPIRPGALEERIRERLTGTAPAR